MQHHPHPDIVKRLKRAEGHLRSVIAMIEEHKSCVAIAQQLHAVEAAIAGAKRKLIHDHMEHCLGGESLDDVKATLEDLKTLAKHL